jgi:hypothetical protein
VSTRVNNYYAALASGLVAHYVCCVKMLR